MKVLLIAFNTPPQALTSATRPTWLARQLAVKGHEVSLLTVDPRFTKNDARDTRRDMLAQAGVKIIDLAPSLRVLAPDYYVGASCLAAKAVRAASRAIGLSPHHGWLKSLEAFAWQTRKGDWDTVIGSAKPYETIEGALKISDQAGAKLVVDYRDPCWVGALPAFDQGTSAQREKEMSVLQRADLITLIGWTMKERLAEQSGLGPKIEVITNGYELEEFRGVAPTQFSRPTLVFGGTIYPGFRTLVPLYEAYAFAAKSSPSLPKLVAYVRNPNEQAALAEQMGISGHVEAAAYVPRAESLAAVAGSLACVVVASSRNPLSYGDRSIVTSKVFEAIALDVPVLLIGPREGDAAKVVEAYGKGVIFEPEEVEAMAQWLADPRFGSSRSHPEAFSWDHLGRQFADLLEGLHSRS